MRSADNITLNRLLTLVAKEGASDLHLTIGSPPVVRKDGHLQYLNNEEILTVNFLERVLDSLLLNEEKNKLERNGNLIITKTLNKVLRYRIHIYKQKGYYSVAFRYIPLLNYKMSDLGLPKYLEDCVRFKKGLVIIAGIYDSGKSTSLAAILNTLNELGPPHYINTLERPIEYLFANNRCIIEQREIGKDVSSYRQGLQLALEGDIDMVVLDKVSDTASIKKMFEVAEAGRTVIITVSAYSTVGALSKIISGFKNSDLEWGKYVLSKHLQCILTQRLVPKMGGGRVLVYEFLINNETVSSLILQGDFDRIPSVFRGVKKTGMVSMEESLASFVQKGEIKLEDALMEANDKDYLKTLLR